MIESLIGTIAIVALIIVVARQNSRIGLLEREIGALRSFVLANPPVAGETQKAAAAPGAEADLLSTEPVAETSAGEAPAAAADLAATETAAEPGPWSAAASISAEETAKAEATAPVADAAQPAAAAVAAPKRPDIETALGTRWAAFSSSAIRSRPASSDRASG